MCYHRCNRSWLHSCPAANPIAVGCATGYIQRMLDSRDSQLIPGRLSGYFTPENPQRCCGASPRQHACVLSNVCRARKNTIWGQKKHHLLLKRGLGQKKTPFGAKINTFGDRNSTVWGRKKHHMTQNHQRPNGTFSGPNSFRAEKNTIWGRKKHHVLVLSTQTTPYGARKNTMLMVFFLALLMMGPK